MDTAANPEDNMRSAIARFRTRMATANQKFIQDRIHEIEAKGLATEEEKRYQLRQYRWLDDLAWDDESRDHSDVLIHKDTPVVDLDIPTSLGVLPSHYPVDGFLPPLLHTEQWREMYLDTIHRVCQAQADKVVADDESERDLACNYPNHQRPAVVPRCAELAVFLKYARGVVDADFRDSGIAPFMPAGWIGVKDEELAGLDDPQKRDKLADPELLKREQEELERNLKNEMLRETLEAFIDSDLDVRAGFITGVGFNRRFGCPEWYSAYVYCRLWATEDEDEGDEKPEAEEEIQDAANIGEWGWRVVVFQAEVDNPSVLYGRRARFNSIPEFLDWYASWLDHLDARALLSLRRHAVGCEIDCESDCEDH